VKAELFFGGVITGLVVIIILLASMFFQPEEETPELNFEYLMNLTADKRGSLAEVNLTYIVNMSLSNGQFLVGEMNFYKNKTDTLVTISPQLTSYEGYGLLLSPEALIEFIQVNDREEYSGELFNRGTGEYCWSTITEPNSTSYDKLIDGDYLFITCFDKETGYPLLTYASEVGLEEDVVYSEIYVSTKDFTA